MRRSHIVQKNSYCATLCPLDLVRIAGLPSLIGAKFSKPGAKSVPAALPVVGIAQLAPGHLK